MAIDGFVFYTGNHPTSGRAARSTLRSHSSLSAGDSSANAPAAPARVPHIDGATRHAAHTTWSEPAHASLARARAYYARAGDALGRANVLRTRADVASAANDYRSGAQLPSSYAHARALYERAASVFDELLCDEARRPPNTTQRQTMIRAARDRGAPRLPIPEQSVSRTRALEDGRRASTTSRSRHSSRTAVDDREAARRARTALRFV